MANAIDMIRRDHETVKKLFKKFDQADSPKQKKEIANETVMELEVHAKIEEEILYPRVREVGDLDPMMNEAEEEHHAAKLLMLEVARMDPENEYFEAKFHVLRESVLHHIEEEESEMLPEAEKLGDRELNELGKEIERRKPRIEEEVENMLEGDLLALAKGILERGAKAMGKRS